MLIAKNVPGANAETQARLLQGLIGGIGFIGGGAILKEGTNVWVGDCRKYLVYWRDRRSGRV